MVGAGAVVTRDVPPLAIVVGNPAAVTGYVETRKEGETRLRPNPPPFSHDAHQRQSEASTELPGGAKLYQLPRISDPRGNLTFAEVGQSLPFTPERYFLVFGVPSHEVRGEHAHRELHQFLVAVNGSVAVRMFDGQRSEEITLDRPELGLHVPPMLWTTEYKYSPDAVLMVLASALYRESDYIRSNDEFCSLVGAELSKKRSR
jgi:hypothetical protein